MEMDLYQREEIKKIVLRYAGSDLKIFTIKSIMKWEKIHSESKKYYVSGAEENLRERGVLDHAEREGIQNIVLEFVEIFMTEEINMKENVSFVEKIS